MSSLAMFLKGSDTRLGVFYPDHILLAIFPNLQGAQKGKDKLRGSGFSDDEALVAPGSDLADLIREETDRTGFFGRFMITLSRFLHTEAAYTDRDLARARRGAAVLAVRCPDEHTKTEAWNAIASTDPLAARHYKAGGIEHLAGET